MSTIVVNPNNTPDWRTQALLGFIGPVIGDWIKSEREKEVNRKNNAAIYEAAQSLNLTSNDYANLPPSMSNNNGGLLGGSNNGWQNTFRNTSDNPLATFDANTADIAPNPNPNVAASLAQPQQRIPTPAEFMQAMANVVGSQPRRFGLVNLKNLQELAAPIMAAYETSRNEQRRKEVADAFSAAYDNPLNQRNIITSAFINGLVPHELVTDATHNYEYENPHLIQGSYDAGGENYFYNYNPRTGEYNFNTQVNKSLSPQQVQAGQQWQDTHNEGIRRANLEDARYYAGLEEQKRQHDADLQEKGREFDAGHEINTRKQNEAEKQAQWERDNPTLTSYRGRDGTLYLVNPRTGDLIEAKTPNGKTVKITPNTSYTPRIYQDNNGNFVIIDPTTGSSTPVITQDGTQQQGQPKNISSKKDLTKSQELRYKATEKEATELRKQQAEHRRTMSIFADEPNDPRYIDAKQNLERIENRLLELEEEQRRILGDTSNNPQNSTQVGNTPFLTPQEKQQAQNNDVVVAHFKPLYRTVENPDVTTYVRPDVSPDVKPAPRKHGDKVTATLPDEIWFDTNRDKDIPQEQVMTEKEFAKWFSEALGDPTLKHLTPEQILEIAINKGIRIQKNNTQSSLPPEETGTTFMGEALLGLQSNGEMAASLTPIGLSRNNSGKYSHGTLAEIPDRQESLPPIPKEYLSQSYQTPTAKDLGYVMQNVPDDINNSDLENYISRNILGLPVRIDKVEKGKNISASTGSPILWISRNGDYGITQKTYDALQRDIQNGKYPNFTSEMDLDDVLYDELRYRPISEAGAVNRKAPPPPSEPPRNKPHFTPHDKWKYYRSDAGQYDNDFDDSELLATTNTKGSIPRKNKRAKRRVRAKAPQKTQRRAGQIRPNTSYEQLKSSVDNAARNHGLEPELVRAIIQVESRWDSNALSRAGAKGLMQLMPGTAREVGVRDAYNAAQNINGGSKYIARMIRMFNGNVANALMAYNWGPGNVRKALKGRKSIPAGVRNYARNVMAIYNNLKSRRGR